MDTKNFKVRFHFQKRVELEERKRLKQFVADRLVEQGKCGSEINFIFCSDEDLLEINRKHLDHDYYTDIITFDLSEKGSCILVSDIYISVDRVKENAKDVGVTAGEELYRVIFHGILHLIGYNDKKEAQKKEMRELEGAWIRQFIGQEE